jgi:hypothetical protein
MPTESWFTIEISKIITLKKNKQILLMQTSDSIDLNLEVCASKIHVVQVLFVDGNTEHEQLSVCSAQHCTVVVGTE